MSYIDLLPVLYTLHLLIFLILSTCLEGSEHGHVSGMQFAGDGAPAGPAAYSDSDTFGPNTYAPSGSRWNGRHILEVVLDGLPPRERETVRRRNGLPANGPWEEVYVVSSADVEADVADFEWCLKTLVTTEAPGEEEQGRVHRIPRVTDIRDTISECLEPLYHDTPEVFDVQRMAFYDSGERAFLKERIASLLAALYACQTLSMNSVELRGYLKSKHKTAYQIERTKVFVDMVERYRSTFVPVWGGERDPLRTAVGACQRW